MLMKHITRVVLVSACLAGSATLAPTLASAGVGIDINIAPPAPWWCRTMQSCVKIRA
jgi:hypothetical protein